MYQNILVPIDDSSTSNLALEEAAKIVLESGGVLRLTHVVDLAQFGWGGSEFLDATELQKNSLSAGEKVLEDTAAALRARGVKVETVLLESWGDKISDLLLQEAERSGVDLIAMGTHGWGELMQLLMGSVAEGVLRHSRVPVLLLRAS